MVAEADQAFCTACGLEGHEADDGVCVEKLREALLVARLAISGAARAAVLHEKNLGATVRDAAASCAYPVLRFVET